MFPFWSPDSKSIGFFADGSLKKIDASGGPVRILCKANSGRGGSWSKDGTIIFCPALNPTELFRINASGGAPEPLTVLDSIQGYVSHRWPHFLPDGEHFLYCARSATATIGDKDGIFLGSLDPTFKPRLIVNSGSSVAYANGRILYTVGQTLMAKPFNIQSFQTMGDAVPIAEDVQFASISAKASFSVSANGLLVFQTKSYSKQSGLSLRQRKTNTSKRITREKSVYNDVRFSPDEKWMVVSLLDAQTGNTDLWLYEFNREIWTRFTFDPNSQRWPIWSPDGRNVVYSSLYENSKFSLLIKAADGSTIEKVLLKDENDNVANHWSADGKFIIYERRDKRSTDLWILPTTGDSKPFPFLQTEFNEYGASFSPDGRWVAYTSNESGRNEVYVRPFPGPGGKSQVSVSGGFYPKWRSDGKEIFYNIRNNTQATEISLGPSSIEVGVTREIFTSQTGPSNNSFDVTRDGQRFLFVDGESENFSPLTLVVNWPEELKKK
jgi:Tol biopolymer transport system component